MKLGLKETAGGISKNSRSARAHTFLKHPYIHVQTMLRIHNNSSSSHDRRSNDF